MKIYAAIIITENGKNYSYVETSDLDNAFDIVKRTKNARYARFYHKKEDAEKMAREWNDEYKKRRKFLYSRRCL